MISSHLVAGLNLDIPWSAESRAGSAYVLGGRNKFEWPGPDRPRHTGTSLEEGSMLDWAGGTLPLHPGSIVSIRTVCRHCLAKARVCVTAAVCGNHTGENYAQAPQ
jgi:hypothetical protein